MKSFRSEELRVKSALFSTTKPTGSIDVVLGGVGQQSCVGALDVLPDLHFKLPVVALGLVELPVVWPSGSPLRAGLQQLLQPVGQRALLPGQLDQRHQGDEGDGGEGNQPAQEVGPVWVLVAAVLVTGVVQGREQQDTLTNISNIKIFQTI